MTKGFATFAALSTMLNGALNLISSLVLAGFFGEEDFIQYATYMAVLSVITLALSGYFLVYAEVSDSPGQSQTDSSLAQSVVSTALPLSAIWVLAAILIASQSDLELIPLLFCALGVWVSLVVGLIDGRLVAMGKLWRLQISTTTGAFLKLVIVGAVMLVGIQPTFVAVLLSFGALISTLLIGLPLVWHDVHRSYRIRVPRWNVVLGAAIFWTIIQIPTLIANGSLNAVSASNFAFAQTLVLAAVSLSTMLGLAMIGEHNRAKYQTRGVLRLIVLVGLGGSSALVLLALLAAELPILSEFQDLRTLLLILSLSVVPWSLFVGLGQRLVVEGTALGLGLLLVALIFSGLVYSWSSRSVSALAFAVVLCSFFLALGAILLYRKQVRH